MRRFRPLTADEKDTAFLRGQKEYRRGTPLADLVNIADGDESLALMEHGWLDQRLPDKDGKIFGCDKR